MEKLVIVFLIYLVAAVVKFLSTKASDATTPQTTVAPQSAPDNQERMLSEVEAYLAGQHETDSGAPSRPYPASPAEPLRPASRVAVERSESGMRRPAGASGAGQQSAQKDSGQSSRKRNRQGARGSENAGRPAGQTASGRRPQPARAGDAAVAGGGVRAHVDQHMRNQIAQHVREDLSSALPPRDERMDLRSESPSASDHSGRSASLTQLLSSPEGVRQAFLVSEILSRPRVFQKVRDRAS